MLWHFPVSDEIVKNLWVVRGIITFGTNGLKARCGFPKVKKHLYAYIYITFMYSDFALSISASNVWACVIYKCPYVRLWRVHV